MNKTLQYAISFFFVAVLVLGWGLRFLGLEPDILLYGSFTPSQMPKFEMKTLLTGQYQTQFDANIKESFPFRKAFVKIYNQTIHQAFRQSPLKSVEVGADNVLFEKTYLQDYFGLNANMNNQFFKDTIADLKYVQDAMEKRGKFFYLFITPSKADFYHEYAPFKYRFVKKRDGYQRNYDKLLGFLQNSGLNYFDCAAYLKEIQSSLDMPLFDKTGTHWNRVTAAIAMAQFTKEFADTYGSGILPIAEYEGAVEFPPDKERDIYLLMNTLQRFSDKDYMDVKHFAPVVKTAGRVSGYSIFCQGGSFQYEFLAALRQVFHGAINRIQNKALFYNDQSAELKSLDGLDMKKVLQQDVLLLECNQAATLGINASFIKLLRAYIEKTGFRIERLQAER